METFRQTFLEQVLEVSRVRNRCYDKRMIFFALSCLKVNQVLKCLIPHDLKISTRKIR